MAELWAAWLANYAVHSTLLIGVAWLVTTLARLQPATRELVWRLALLGGVATASGAVAGQMLDNEPVPGAPRQAAMIRVVADHVVTGGPPRTLGGPVRIEGRIADPTPECRAVLRGSFIGGVESLAAIRSACGARALPWLGLVGLIWFLGAGAGGVLELRRRRALVHLTESLGEPDSRTLGIVSELTAATGVRVRRIGLSHLVASPGVLPGGVLVLPARCIEELTREELKAAVAHELAHVARHDVWWLCLSRWIAVLGWVQPLNWVPVRRLREAAEGICDDWAVSRTGAPAALARSITTVVGWARRDEAVSVPVAMVGGSPEGLTDRIVRILGDRRVHADPLWLHLTVVALLAAPVLLVPSLPVPEGPRAYFVVRMNGVMGHDRVESLLGILGPLGGELGPRWEIGPGGGIGPPDGARPRDEATTPKGPIERRVVVARLRGD